MKACQSLSPCHSRQTTYQQMPIKVLPNLVFFLLGKLEVRYPARRVWVDVFQVHRCVRVGAIAELGGQNASFELDGIIGGFVVDRIGCQRP